MYSTVQNPFSGIFWTIVLIYLIVDGIGAYFMGKAAEDKGYEGWGCFWVCFLLGIMGYMYVIALPNKKLMEQNERIIECLRALSMDNGSVNYDMYANEELPEL